MGTSCSWEREQRRRRLLALLSLSVVLVVGVVAAGCGGEQAKIDALPASESVQVTALKPKVGSPPEAIEFVAVDFVDSEHGWAIGDANGVGVALRTTDGVSWRAVEIPDTELTALDFVDSNTGCVSGRSRDGESAVSLGTSDGGSVWTTGRLEGFTASAGRGALAFLNRRHGWMVGKLGNGKAAAAETLDGGLTWRRVPLNTEIAGSIAFADGKRGWIAGGATAPAPAGLKTVDGGRSWKADAAATAPRAALRRDGAALCGLSATRLVRLQGKEWQAVGSEQPALHLFAFADARYGWGVTAAKGGTKWALLRTSDGGAKWFDCAVDLPGEPAAMACRDAKSVVVVTKDGAIATIVAP